MNKAEIEQLQTTLSAYGFDPYLVVDGDYGPRTRHAVQQFQIAWAGGRSGHYKALEPDGAYGPKSRAALEDSLGDSVFYLSPHFVTTEFRDRSTGHVFVHRSLVRALETLRASYGSIPIQSGSRTWETHKSIYARLRQRVVYGSWHLGHSVPGEPGLYASYAADISSMPVKALWRDVRNMRLFTGIGWNRSTAYVSHLDTRYNRSASSPAIWRYNR